MKDRATNPLPGNVFYQRLTPRLVVRVDRTLSIMLRVGSAGSRVAETAVTNVDRLVEALRDAQTEVRRIEG